MCALRGVDRVPFDDSCSAPTCVVDGAGNYLYVSDSHEFGTPGPGVWRCDLEEALTEGDLCHAVGRALGVPLAADGDGSTPAPAT